MNYLYLKPSSEPVKVGDLIKEGIIYDLSAHDFPYYDIKKSFDEFEGHLQIDNPISLIPLLIMDAPDNIMQSFLSNRGKIGAMKFFDEGKSIPFRSNEQVFEYLKSKGIKPEAEMLIEFDGEVEVKSECISPLPDKCTQNGYPCPLCNKAAIIKDTEVNQEESEISWDAAKSEAIKKVVANNKLAYDDDGIFYEEIFGYLIQNFKIQRK